MLWASINLKEVAIIYTIRKLVESDVPAYVKLQLNAYPAITQTQNQFEEHTLTEICNEGAEYYGAFDGDALVGGMIIYDYHMNLLGSMIRAGGIGSIAVDLCRRKQHIAKEIMGFYLQKLRDEGAPIALLYPFNPAFYKKMGFGFGARLSQFRMKPSDLPSSGNSKSVRQLGVDDAEVLCEFYNREVHKRNGLILAKQTDMEHVLKNQAVRAFASFDNGRMTGYMFTRFKRGGDSFLVNDLVVSEIIFENSDAYLGLMSFLNALADEFRYVILNTQDEELIHSLNDPRYNSEKLLYSVYHESSLSGMGIMYRVTDANHLFSVLSNCNFGGVGVRLRLELADSFVTENNGAYILNVDGGLNLDPDGAYDVTLSIGISEFSSLITCAADLRSLHRYGLCRLSDDKYLNTLHRMFASTDKPLCTTQF